MGNDDFHPTRNMTGGSLPAMTWQRLMEYAHKNIDLKPIPGIENPFVDEETAAKVAEAEKAEAEKNAQEALDRPAVLSPATTRLLKQMSERFRAAPPIDAPAEPKTLSALLTGHCRKQRPALQRDVLNGRTVADHFWVHCNFDVTTEPATANNRINLFVGSILLGG